MPDVASQQLEDWPARWPNFAPSEVACRGCAPDAPCRRDSLALDVAAMDTLQDLRRRYGQPLRVNSAYRCPFHNVRIGGAPHSYHKRGMAFDVSINGMTKLQRQDLATTAIDAGFTGFGFYGSFLHVDIGRPRQWMTKSGEMLWNG